jgi:hypothetical protein
MDEFQRLERAIDNLTKRLSGKNRVLYTSGADFTLPGGGSFFIEVPSGGGSVKYTTEGGQVNTEAMSAGYHPSALTKIWAATAINLVIIF